MEVIRGQMFSFDEIDKLRAANSLSRKQVYERAGIHKETWRRLMNGTSAPNTRTLEKLSRALEALISEKGTRG